MKTIFKSALFILARLSYATTMEEALNQASRYFQAKFENLPPNKQFIIEIKNFYSKQEDEQAKKIHNRFYLALDQTFPGGRVVEPNQSLSGVSINNAISIQGSYEPQGNVTFLRLKAVSNYDGKVLAATEIRFESKKNSQQNPCGHS